MSAQRLVADEVASWDDMSLAHRWFMELHERALAQQNRQPHTRALELELIEAEVKERVG